ncbi:MAG: antitoxin [Acidimicrobiia bacterium]|nr:antitoxin [Acidimicrobiia bacterium]
MKTTLELPDELMREIKIRAVNENRRIKDVVADALRRGLAQGGAAPARIEQRVRLPLVECAHQARSDDEMTPERVAAILLTEEADAFSGHDR